MNEQEFNNLKTICKTASDICMNNEMFKDLVKIGYDDFVHIVNAGVNTSEGLFAHLGKNKVRCWVAKKVHNGYVKIISGSDETSEMPTSWEIFVKLDAYHYLDGK